MLLLVNSSIWKYWCRLLLVELVVVKGVVEPVSDRQ